MSSSISRSTVPVVLVADDNHDAADMLAKWMRLAVAVTPVTAYDGRSALQKALADRPQAAILDLNMPGIGGIEVARRIRERLGSDAPYLIAITGDAEAAEDLEAIDSVFDRAWAKPVDCQQLADVLGRLARADSAELRLAPRLDLAELLTHIARSTVPLAEAKGVEFGFDYTGEWVAVPCDSVAMSRGITRLLLGAMDLVPKGYALLNCCVERIAHDGCRLTLDVAASGMLPPDTVVDAVLQRLGLGFAVDPMDAGSSAGTTGSRTVAGHCRDTGATLSGWIDPHEGVLLRARLDFAGGCEATAMSHQRVEGARVWLVAPDGMPSALRERRLQASGWIVTRWSSCMEVLVRLAADAPMTLPALLIVIDGPSVHEAAGALRDALHETTRCVLAVKPGSPLLGDPSRARGFELAALPFSPRQIEDFGATVGAPAIVASGLTEPASLGFDDRPRVLIVDDSPMHRIVCTAVLQSIGYEVATVRDGLDAIDLCRQQPPDAVLMDLEMAVLSGLNAASRLRSLQLQGQLPPFPIIAATSEDSPAARAAVAAAGMDGFLIKPLDRADVERTLRRFPSRRRAHAPGDLK